MIRMQIAVSQWGVGGICESTYELRDVDESIFLFCFGVRFIFWSGFCVYIFPFSTYDLGSNLNSPKLLAC